MDFSEPSWVALDWGASLARQLGADLMVLTVAGWAEKEGAATGFVTDRRALEEELSSIVRERMTRFDDGVSAAPRVLVREGKPVDEILTAIDMEKIDLLVMGTHGRQGVVRALMGSVTEGVIRQSRCPVLVVRGGIPSPGEPK